MGYKINELVDITSLQKITESLHAFTDVTFGLKDEDDHILVSAGWQNICQDFHRKNPLTNEKCKTSDRYVKNHLNEMNFVEYYCQNGLVELAMPVIVEGERKATIYVGQFFYEGEETSQDFFAKQADKYNFDKEAYMEAYKKIPILTREKVGNIIHYYKELVIAMTQSGYLTLENKASRLRSDQSLSRFNALFNAMDDLVFINDSDYRYVDFYTKNHEDLFLPPSYFVGKTVDEVLPKDIAGELTNAMKRLADGSDFEIIDYQMYVHDTLHWFSAKITKLEYEHVEGIHYLNVVRDITDLKNHEQLIRKIAYYDSLTGLYNRTMFYDRLEKTIQRADIDKSTFTLVFIDLDNFKHINDSRGHQTGDLVLQKIAGRLQEVIRYDDILVRMGGDEFTMILSEFEDMKDVSILVNRLLDTVSHPIELEEGTVYSSCSIGIAVYPLDGRTSSELVKNADAAMYKAKELGKNRYSFFNDTIRDEIQRKYKLETQFRIAANQDQLYLHYQPVIDIASQSIQGFETLMRWTGEDGQAISPREFIPIAESSGLIVPLGYWAIEEACRFNKGLHDASDHKSWVSVNISVIQLAEPDFIDQVVGILKKTKLEPEYLVFEITETLMIDDFKMVNSKLEQAKSLGIKLSLDDFGRGYSSLTFVKNLDLDMIKIDQSFIKDIGERDQDRIILEIILDMAEKLKIIVIAEGVENESQASILSSLLEGCAQGSYYYKPMCQQALGELLKV